MTSPNPTAAPPAAVPFVSSLAFQGEEGSNSNIAAKDAFPDAIIQPCATFEDVFIALKERRADAALVPVENSVIGRIADVHRLLPEYDLSAIGEYFMRIEHNLVAPPAAKLQNLRRVYSQLPALGQCRNMIQAHGLSVVPTADTAGAARQVAQRGQDDEAAIASRLAASIHGLKVLKEDIGDHQHNVTRFLILRNNDAAPWPILPLTDPITIFLFRIRNVPASLYKALGGFATNNINMIKLESCPLEGSFEATRFYAEITDHPDNPAADRAFKELAFHASDVRILGVYRRDSGRHEALGGATALSQ